MQVSVIISTHNNPQWLEKVLWGYEVQSYKFFEILIADDGSTEDTRKLIEQFQAKSKLRIIHIWQPRNGYQKCQILNKALRAANSDYLIFSDGDCIPRHDFVEQHVLHAEPSCFLSGGIVRLPMRTSALLTKDDIQGGRSFSLRYLRRLGHKRHLLKNLKLVLRGGLALTMNRLTPRKPTWNGCNSSGWKKDLLAVNGFNETMEYGGQDVECGCRLVNMGIRPKQMVYSLAAIHLDHTRGYKTETSVQKNRMIIREVKVNKISFTPYGLVKT